MEYVALFLYVSGIAMCFDAFDDDEHFTWTCVVLVLLWFLTPLFSLIGDEE